MDQQNYKNHGRVVPAFHYVGGLLLIAGLIGSIVNLVTAAPYQHYNAALIVVVFLILVIIAWYSRIFALRAQDRAIRAEENFRHYLRTGKPLDSQLKLGQIIALRFASDEEYDALAKRTIEEKLSQKQIKQAIRNWRGDYLRV